MSEFYDLFLSHATADKEWVRGLTAELRTHGIHAYFDEERLEAGDNFVLALDDALANSRFLAVVLSRSSADRPWVTHEWTTFRATRGPLGFVVPILLDSVALPTGLAATQVLDATHRDVKRAASEVARVLIAPRENPASLAYAPELTFVVRMPGDGFVESLGADLQVFRALAGRTIETVADRQKIEAYAVAIGRRLYDRLIDDRAAGDLRRAIASGITPTVSIVSDDEALLALPWELMHDGQRFLVRDAVADLVRSTTRGSFASVPAPPEDHLRLLVSVAAPRGEELNYEEESYRISRALSDECDVVTSELGTLDDLVLTAAACSPTGIHFSGHGAPGMLLFETGENEPDEVRAERLVHRLRTETPAGLPRFFYLGCCHGNTPDRSRDGTAAISAGHLHANGIPEVVAYSGPIAEHLATRVEQAMYGAIAAGRPTRFAVRQARLAMLGPADDDAHPFAWSQLVLYRRGPEHPLSLPVSADPARKPDASLARTFLDAGRRRILITGFIGRRTELHEIRRRFREGHRAIVFHGMGGLGKTTLAVEALSLLASREDVCVVWCQDLAARADAAETLVDRLIDYARERCEGDVDAVVAKHDRTFPDDIVRRAQCVLDFVIAQVPNLVLCLDNLESLLAGPEQEGGDIAEWRSPALRDLWTSFVAYAENSGRMRLVVSTRYYNDAMPGRYRFAVPPLQRDALFRLMKWMPSLRRLGVAARARLTERLAGHPRAVEMADALVAHAFEQQENARGPWTSADPDEEWRVLVEPMLPDVQQRLEADLLLDAIWDRVLDDAARRMLYRLTVVRADRWVWDMCRALGDPRLAQEEVDATAEQLRRSSLLLSIDERFTVGGDVRVVRYYQLHPATIQHVRRRFTSTPELDRETHRHIGLVLYAAIDGEKPGPFETYVFHASEASFHFFAAGEYDYAAQAATDAGMKLLLTGITRQAVQLLTPFTTEEIERSLSPTRRTTVYDQLGRAYRQLERFEDALACHRKSAEVAKETGIRDQIAAAGNLANLYQAMKEYDRALELLREVRAMARGIGDRHSEGIQLCNVASILLKLRRLDEAEAALDEAAAVADGVEDFPFEDIAANLGSCFGMQGRHDEALPHFRRAAALAGAAGKHLVEESALGGLGESLRCLRRFDEANGALEAALRVARRIGADDREAGALEQLALNARDAKDWPRFFDVARQFVQAATRLGQHQKAARMSAQIGGIFVERGAWQAAADTLENAIELAKHAGAPDLQAAVMAQLATCRRELGDPAGECAMVQAAVALAADCGDRVLEVSLRQQLASILVRNGDVAAALAECEKAWQRAHRVAGDEVERRILKQLCAIADKLEAYDRSIEPLRRMVEIDRSAGDRPGLETDVILLGVALSMTGQWPEATALVEEGVAIGRELGDASGLQDDLWTLATIYGDQRRYREEGACYEELLAMAESSGESAARGPLLTKLGRIAIRLGEPDRARPLLEEGVRILRETNRLPEEVNALINLGALHFEHDRSAEAIECLTEAAQIAAATGNRKAECTALVNLGLTLLADDELGRGREVLESALAIGKEAGDARVCALASEYLAKLDAAAGGA